LPNIFFKTTIPLLPYLPYQKSEKECTWMLLESSTVATLGNSLNDTHTRTLYPIFKAVTEEHTCREASPHLSVENQHTKTQGNKATVFTTI
jgi:hypothetical protein